MDIKELMLGDLVVYKGEPMKVVFLTDILEECMRLAPLTGCFCTFDYTWAELDQVEPLPITTELLQKNGFLREDFEEDSFMMHTADRTVKLYGDNEGFDLRIFFNTASIDLENIIGVHKLQQALRMAGLGCIADFDV